MSAEDEILIGDGALAADTHYNETYIEIGRKEYGSLDDNQELDWLCVITDQDPEKETTTIKVNSGYTLGSRYTQDDDGTDLLVYDEFFTKETIVPASGGSIYAKVPVSLESFENDEGIINHYWMVTGPASVVFLGEGDDNPDVAGETKIRIATVTLETEDENGVRLNKPYYSVRQHHLGQIVIDAQQLGEGGGGLGEWTHPFRLIRVDNTTWRIETEGSSIIDDNNGSSIPITDLSIDRTSNGYVYIQCEITSGPVPSGVATVLVSATAKDEIEVSGGVQTYANLLIGQVYINLAGDDIDISQAWNNAAILSLMFESGYLRWAFQAYPSHVNSLTAGL